MFPSLESIKLVAGVSMEYGKMRKHWYFWAGLPMEFPLFGGRSANSCYSGQQKWKQQFVYGARLMGASMRTYGCVFVCIGELNVDVECVTVRLHWRWWDRDNRMRATIDKRLLWTVDVQLDCQTVAGHTNCTWWRAENGIKRVCDDMKYNG